MYSKFYEHLCHLGALPGSCVLLGWGSPVWFELDAGGGIQGPVTCKSTSCLSTAPFAKVSERLTRLHASVRLHVPVSDNLAASP
jgi:hypothetical protein